MEANEFTKATIKHYDMLVGEGVDKMYLHRIDSDLANSKRIMIIGCAGSGKTTFAVALSAIVKIPVIHLDKEWWQPNWVETPKDEWHAKQTEFVKEDTWIIDGDYGRSMNIRLERADTIIFLDMNNWVCIYSALKRFVTNIGKVRFDMGAGCKESMDFKFIKWIYNYPKNGRVRNYKRLKEQKDKRIIVLKSRKEVRKWLARLA